MIGVSVSAGTDLQLLPTVVRRRRQRGHRAQATQRGARTGRQGDRLDFDGAGTLLDRAGGGIQDAAGRGEGALHETAREGAEVLVVGGRVRGRL